MVIHLQEKHLLKKYSVKDKVKGVGIIGDALLKPTEIYTKPVLEMVQKCKSKWSCTHYRWAHLPNYYASKK